MLKALDKSKNECFVMAKIRSKCKSRGPEKENSWAPGPNSPRTYDDDASDGGVGLSLMGIDGVFAVESSVNRGGKC